MKKLSLMVCLLSGGIVACAQKADTRKSPVAASPYAKSILATDLKKHLYILAADDMEGRETGTPGQYKAARYIIDQFKRIGLQPGAGNGEWEQPFTLNQDTLAEASITAAGKTFEFGKDFYAALRDSKNQELEQTGVVFAGLGTVSESFDSYKGIDANDKIVVIDGSRLAGTEQKDRLRAAANHGARAVFIVSNNLPGMSRAGSRLRRTGLYFADMASTMEFIPNAYFISPDMASAIFGKPYASLAEGLTANNPVPSASGQVTGLVFKKGVNEIRSSNILGVLPGTDKKDEYVFITAHYDHIGIINGEVHNGADDDGSGTVAVIAMAEAFMKAKKAGKGPRRTIVFMPVSGEEKGLLGSRYYTEHPVYPLASTVTDLNIDMIGRVDAEHEKNSNYVYIIGDNKLSSDLRPISEAANKLVGLKLDYKYNDPSDPNRFYYRSDHYMFAQHRIPIIFYFNGVHPDYHGPHDTAEKINYPLLAKRTQLVFYTAWDVANRNDRLKVDRNEK